MGASAAAKKKKESKRSKKTEKRREPRRIVNKDQSGPSDEATRRNIEHLMKLASADQVDETTGSGAEMLVAEDASTGKKQEMAEEGILKSNSSHCTNQL